MAPNLLVEQAGASILWHVVQAKAERRTLNENAVQVGGLPEVASVQFSQHALEMMRQRSIPEEWVTRTLDTPDRTDNPPDGTIHYIKAIPEHGGRFLRVVVNPATTPRRVVTMFFDRRLGRHP